MNSIDTEITQAVNSNKRLDLDILRQCEHSKIIIVLPTNVSSSSRDGDTSTPNGIQGIQAFMTQDTFAVEGSAQYDAQYKMSAAGTKLGKLFELGSGLFASQKRLELMLTSRLVWVDSQRPVFNLDLLFIGTKKYPDPRVNASALLEGTQPYDESGSATALVNAPWKFSFSKADESSWRSSGTGAGEGKITVQIGKWFKATNQVLLSASFNFSRETTERGYPLYAQGSIQFTPFMLTTSYDMRKFFVGLS